VISNDGMRRPCAGTHKFNVTNFRLPSIEKCCNDANSGQEHSSPFRPDDVQLPLYRWVDLECIGVPLRWAALHMEKQRLMCWGLSCVWRA
jgi:hypothetical protein